MAVMKKIDRAVQFLTQNPQLLICPHCQQPLNLSDYHLTCVHGHQYDLSKKGTLYLMKRAVTSDYDSPEMWQARRQMLSAGLFDGILEAINEVLPNDSQIILDIGCGEATPLARLAQLRHNEGDRYLGFDISKDAVNLATQHDLVAFFCLADLANLPYQDRSVDAMIDIFSPSAYQEFNRVLKDDGLLLKVIPGADYLGQLRRLLYPDINDQHHRYSNAKVRELFFKHYSKAKEIKVNYIFPLTPVLFPRLLAMTPLQWGASADRIATALAQGLREITVDVSLLVAQKRK